MRCAALSGNVYSVPDNLQDPLPTIHVHKNAAAISSTNCSMEARQDSVVFSGQPSSRDSPQVDVTQSLFATKQAASRAAFNEDIQNHGLSAAAAHVDSAGSTNMLVCYIESN